MGIILLIVRRSQFEMEASLKKEYFAKLSFID